MVKDNNNNLTLAITSVGNLLIHNNIARRNETSQISGIKLVIPDYQRPYKWTAKNAIQLLDDIIEAKNNNKEIYRVGTLILHKGKDSCNNVIYNIVDGQQRTITFSLLLTALYQISNENLNEHNIALLEQSLFDNKFNKRNISNNYEAFIRRFSINNGEENAGETRRQVKALREYIESQCEFIVVITDNISEAFQFFDSQNARGKTLYPHDLLKAFHLREMREVSDEETEKIVKQWEKIPQEKLSKYFGDLYRMKEWMNGNYAEELNEKTIHLFKGITKLSRAPFAQYYKSAYSYAQMINTSAMPFVAGIRDVNSFQLNAPIIAGKPFFDYTNHYYSILEDIRDNSKYVGFYISGNEIVKTLDKYCNSNLGFERVRLLFDTAILLYVDRFCPATHPTRNDLEFFEQFVVYAFIWAYSLRIQYTSLPWIAVQNHVMGRPSNPNKGRNAFNIYKLVLESELPTIVLSSLVDKLVKLPNQYDEPEDKVEFKNNLIDEDGICKDFRHYFRINNYI